MTNTTAAPSQTVTNSPRLTLLESQFLHWLLVDPEHGVIRFATEKERPAIEAVANLHQRAINGNVVLDEEWAAARAAARDAAWDAAWDAAIKKQNQKLDSLYEEHGIAKIPLEEMTA